MARYIGWPFGIFIIAGSIAVILGLVFVGYQDLFAVYETEVHIEGDAKNILDPGEGIVVTFNVPIHTASLSHALHPDTETQITWEDGLIPNYASTLIVTPTSTIKAGEIIVHL